MMLFTRSELDSLALCVAQATGLTRPGSEAYIKQAAMGAKQGVWDGAVPVGNTLRCQTGTCAFLMILHEAERTYIWRAL
ncbi:hypothetical protein LBMAG38_26030 [Chloroflexota bacterium]|nr:hypothetical protein LBMAG38_26030 [Chloroflexota bacterium]